MKRILLIAAALALLCSHALAQSTASNSYRLVPQSSIPPSLSGNVGLWSNSGNSNHPTLHVGGVDYDLLYTLGGLSVSVTVPTSNQLLFFNNGSSQWAPRLLQFSDLSTPGLFSAPGTAQNILVDNTTGYISVPQTINVKACGAKGDGSTDDTTAIQTCLDTYLRDKGGVLFFPLGTYLISSQIGLIDTVSPSHTYANITLEGVGYGSQIKSSVCIGNGTGGTGMFYIHGTSAYSQKNSGIRRLRVTGCDESTTVGPLITYSNTDGSFAIDSYIDTTRDEGLYWNDPSSEQNITVKGNYATRIGGWGASISSDIRSAYNVNATNASMLDNRAFQTGIAVEQTGSGIFINNRIDSCGYNSPPTGTYYTCMSMESTSSSGKFVVEGNTIRNGNNCLSLGGSATGEMTISNNIFEFCNTGVSLTNTTTGAVIKGNLFFDTISGSQGSAIVHSSGSVGALIEGNNIITGSTQWATVYLNSDSSAADIVRGNLVVGNAVTSQVFKVNSSNTNTELIDNVIQGGAMSSARTRYQWQGVNYSASTFSGIDSGTVLSTKRRSVVAHSAAPTTGTWNLGDTVLNTSPTATGIEEWVNTTAGTPGTWTPIYFVPQSSSVTNSMLANSSVTVNTTSPLGGGGSVSLGGTALSLTCSACIVSGDVHLLPTPPAAGAVLYSNGTNWVSLAAGSGSQFLQGGTTPSWAVPAGSGTVTSVTCGTDLTGGTFTTSGTCALNTTITQNITHSGSDQFNSHIIGGGGAPAIVVQTGQCGGSCTGSVTGSDIAFEVTLTPSGTTTAGNQFRITPTVTWGAVPYCVLHPSNSLARSNGSYDLYFDRAASSTSSLFFSLTTSTLVSTSTYKWIVHCTQ